MKKFYQILSYILVALGGASAMFVALTLTGLLNVSKLEELQTIIEDRYIGELDVPAMEDAAAEAMVAAIGDRWSGYMNAEAYLDYQNRMSNSYVGVGMTIQALEAGGFEVVKVEPNGPAAEAGVENGDVVIGVNGEDVTGLTTTELSAIVKGKAGTTVDVTFTREGEERTLTIPRREIQTVVAEGRMLEGSVGLVSIYNFESRCYDETIAALESLLDQGAQKLIFDVRGNPGGYQKELVKILDYLLPEGDLFRSEYYTGSVVVDKSDAKCLEMPMAVLINGNSYSAAEFFAAALEEYDAAVTVGLPTTGKGYFQTAIRLSDGSAVRLSVGRYTTPNGVSLADVGGLQPNILVEVDDETAAAIAAGTLEPENDPQIQAALEALKGE